MAKFSDLLHIESDMEAGISKEEQANPTLVGLAETVAQAVLDGLDTSERSFMTATCRSMIVQKALFKAMDHFDRMKMTAITGQKENTGYA